MGNREISQQERGVTWQVLLDEAKKRFADARTAKERQGFRDSIRAFEKLIKRGARVPKRFTAQ